MPKTFPASLITAAFAVCPLAAEAQMPEGKAKPLVEGVCSHQTATNRVIEVTPQKR